MLNKHSTSFALRLVTHLHGLLYAPAKEIESIRRTFWIGLLVPVCGYVFVQCGYRFCRSMITLAGRRFRTSIASRYLRT